MNTPILPNGERKFPHATLTNWRTYASRPLTIYTYSLRGTAFSVKVGVDMMTYSKRF